ncbi:MAG TPA: (S)-ureidoglycine aminohydrolase [Opitutaceae bacterium]|nr:(S)-ureidoglycine aminohydrolase [Opitutaceae bacterium]
MNPRLGQTRTHIGIRHALIAPDGHVRSSVPGITDAATVILISEAMGAKFAQLLVTFTADGRAALPANDVETAGYFETGAGVVTIGRDRKRCEAGGFFFAPAGRAWSITAPAAGTRLTLFQKRYVPLRGAGTPRAIIGDAARVKGEPFLGDPNARLQVLLPDVPAFDLAMNRFTFQPGATLPFVETHIMEHGLLMLSGKGTYRLEDKRYAVATGDVIWMAPYCPQWFVAQGRAAASYLYYKDINRPAL